MHQRLTEREIECLGRILKLNERKLLSYIVKFVKDYDDAQDILSEAYIKALNGYHTIRDKERISSWLHRVCYSAIVDFFRWEKFDERLKESIPVAGPGIEERVISEDYVRWFVKELPQNYQGLLALDALGNASGKEGAKCFNISLTAYKSRLDRARKAAREKFNLELELQNAEYILRSNSSN